MSDPLIHFIKSYADPLLAICGFKPKGRASIFTAFDPDEVDCPDCLGKIEIGRVRCSHCQRKLFSGIEVIYGDYYCVDCALRERRRSL